MSTGRQWLTRGREVGDVHLAPCVERVVPTEPRCFFLPLVPLQPQGCVTVVGRCSYASTRVVLRVAFTSRCGQSRGNRDQPDHQTDLRTHLIIPSSTRPARVATNHVPRRVGCCRGSRGQTGDSLVFTRQWAPCIRRIFSWEIQLDRLDEVSSNPPDGAPRWPAPSPQCDQPYGRGPH